MRPRTSGARGEQCGGILYFALNGWPVRRLMAATGQDGQSKKILQDHSRKSQGILFESGKTDIFWEKLGKIEIL